MSLRPPSAPGCPRSGGPVCPTLCSAVSLTTTHLRFLFGSLPVPAGPASVQALQVNPSQRTRPRRAGQADSAAATPGANKTSRAGRRLGLVDGTRRPREVRLGRGSALVPAVLQELTHVARGQHG